MKNIAILISGLLLLCTLYGCVQLKEVHAFTESSRQTLETDHQVGYGYADYCWDSCYIYNTTGRQLVDFDCNSDTIDSIDNAVKGINDINKAITIAAGLITLAAAIVTENGGGIVSSLQTIAGAVKG